MVALLCYLKRDAEANCYLPGAPSTIAGAPFSRLMLPSQAFGPSRCFQGVPSSRTAAQRHLKGAFRTASATRGYQRALMKGFLALGAKQNPTVLLFLAHVNSRQCCSAA